MRKPINRVYYYVNAFERVKAEIAQKNNSSSNKKGFDRSKYEHLLQSGYASQNTLTTILCMCGARLAMGFQISRGSPF